MAAQQVVGRVLVTAFLLPLLAGCLPAGWGWTVAPAQDPLYPYPPAITSPSPTPTPTPTPKPKPQSKPDMTCLKLTKGEITRADELVKIAYGGTITRYAKVHIYDRFYVVATRIQDPLSGGRQYPGKNHGLPKTLTATWLFYKMNDGFNNDGDTVGVEVIRNWKIAEEGITLKYGPQVRKRAIACVS